MPTYIYEALSEDGNVVRGVLEAETRTGALNHLKQYRFRITNIQQQSRLKAFLSQLRRVSLVSVAVFTRQFANMIRAGVPVMRCFDLLSTKGENRRFENIILLVKEHVKAGSSLSQALARYPEAFDPVYLALVRSGEVSGEIAQILDRTASYLEKSLLLRRRVRAAMTYPIVVFVMAVLISFLLILYIFPKFTQLFQGFNLTLPLPTRILILLVDTFKNPIVVVILIAAVASAAFLLSQYVKTTIGKRHLDQWILHIPLFGSINRKVAVSRFCRTFSTLFGSGVPVLHALEITSRITGNEMINEAIEHTREAVRYGTSISAPLEESGYFPPMVVNMIQVGEQTGDLHTMLAKISDYYDLEVELSLLALTKMLEPILIGVMGLVVGFVVVAIFLPIYQLIGNFGQ